MIFEHADGQILYSVCAFILCVYTI